MADQVAVMGDGRIAQVAAPGDLYSAPVDLGVATFVGDAVVLDVVAAGSYAESPLGALELRSPVSGAGRAVVRPEQIVLGEAGAGVEATVTGTVFYGHDAIVRVAVRGNDGQVPVAVRRLGAPTDVEVGDSVGVRVVGPVSFYPGG